MSETDGSDLDGVRDAMRAVQRFVEEHGLASDIGEFHPGVTIAGFEGPYVMFTGKAPAKLKVLAGDAEQRMEDAGLVAGDPRESHAASQLHVAYDLLRETRLDPQQDDVLFIQGTVRGIADVLRHGINAVGQVAAHDDPPAVRSAETTVVRRSALVIGQEILQCIVEGRTGEPAENVPRDIDQPPTKRITESETPERGTSTEKDGGEQEKPDAMLQEAADLADREQPPRGFMSPADLAKLNSLPLARLDQRLRRGRNKGSIPPDDILVNEPGLRMKQDSCTRGHPRQFKQSSRISPRRS